MKMNYGKYVKEKYKFFPFDYIVVVGENKDISYLEKIGVQSSKILTFKNFLKKQGTLYKILCYPFCVYEIIEKCFNFSNK